MSTLTRKSWADLTRHPARTLLAVLTLAVATASLSFLAVPSLINAAMNRQVQASHLADLEIFTNVIDLTPAQLSGLAHLPGIAAVSTDLGYVARATSAAGTQDIAIAGGGLSSAAVDTVPLLSGRLPGPGQILADAGDGRAADYDVPVGSVIRVRAASGALVPLRVSGTGINLAATPGANGSTQPVFYATAATVEALRGVRGIDFLGVRLADDTPAGAQRAITAIRSYLTAQAGPDPITALPVIRAAGQWPGKTAFGHDIALLYIITILAFLSALFLIAATMNTLIAEQAGEIAILKTLGGRRPQISAIFLRTAALLGAAGAIAGTVVGIGAADLLARYFAERLIDVAFGFGVAPGVVVASLVIGPVLAVAASLPALRRALRRPVAQTLAGGGTTEFGAGRLDRLVARSGLLTGARVPGSVRMGVRNALRSKRRSAAAIAQVAVAAGLAVAFLALGQSVTAVISKTIGYLHMSLSVGEGAGSAARPFTSAAVAAAAATPGITGVQPVETASLDYRGQAYVVWGLSAHPLYSYRLSAGHWFTSADTAPSARPAIPPVVLGPAVARAAGARVGQVVTLQDPAGPVRARVIGIDTGQNEAGQIIYFPRPVLERLDGNPGASDSLWLTTASSSHAVVDRATAAVAARLTAAGFPVTTQKTYVTQAQITATDASLLAVIETLGLVVVAIMLLGLASALSMGVLERTREIGILRCVGARARNIRRVFSMEAAVLAVAGWAGGVLVGWLIYTGLLALVRHVVDLTLPVRFSPVIALITLAGVVGLTLIVIRGPLRRATRVQPGAALRYQ